MLRPYEEGHRDMHKRPNIVFVFADQLRGSSLGHVGQEQVLTPNLDCFAEQGIRFTRAVSNAPLCCPMRASLITGQHPLSHGILGNDILLREDAPSIAKSLSQAGYDTAYIGKWHLDGPDRTAFTPPGPRRHGFDFWAAVNCNHSYLVSYYYRDTPEPIWDTGYEPTAQTDLAIEYLADHAGREEPLCMFLSWEPPHCPYDQVPDTFKRLYDTNSLTPRQNAVDPDMSVTANYYAHISALDHEFGRLLEALDTPELRENTLVVFTSDHGDMLYSHGRGWKCKPWQESVIVPFIARWPGVVPAGVVEDAPFGLVNTVPTLLSLCGVQVPNEMDGEAMPHLLLHTDGPRPTSTPIYFYMKATNPSPDVWRGVVTKSHTYARFREAPWILYDDSADPYQMRNLAEDPSCSQLQQTMERELQSWLAKLGDGFETDLELAKRYGIEVDERGIPPYYYRPEIMRTLHEKRQELTRANQS